MDDSLLNSLPDRDVISFIEFVKNKHGLDLSGYKRSFVARRIIACLGMRKVRYLKDYQKLIDNDPEEWDLFLDNLSINVSEFFRDPDVFDVFEKSCIPEIVKRVESRGRRTIDCWSCGCARGEEPYTLAIIFERSLQRNAPGKLNFDIYASDVDKEALAAAEKGVYRAAALKNIENRLIDFFDLLPNDNGREYDLWRIKDKFRKSITFQAHNVAADVMPGKFDVIFFRNVRIYFKPAAAVEIIKRLHGVLRDNGYLVLGRVEVVGLALHSFFELVDIKRRIYRKI